MDEERDVVATALRAGIYTRLVGRRLLHFHRLSSTMDEARRRGAAGEEEGTTVVAEEQTLGRGRLSHRWVSPPGNLYCSVLLRPPSQTLPFLAIVATVATVRAVAKATGLQPRVKWPNDVQYGGRKLAGVLVEASVDEQGRGYAVLGIGINVNLDPQAYPEVAQVATSLRRELGRPVARAPLLKHLLEELDALYAETLAGSPPLAQWRALLDTLGKRVRVRWDAEVYEGLAQDVDALGNLLLRRADGSLVTLPAGEVTSQV